MVVYLLGEVPAEMTNLSPETRDHAELQEQQQAKTETDKSVHSYLLVFRRFFTLLAGG